jgi:hypothetical protein
VVILTPAEVDQGPLPDDASQIVPKGEREDGGERMNHEYLRLLQNATLQPGVALETIN